MAPTPTMLATTLLLSPRVPVVRMDTIDSALDRLPIADRYNAVLRSTLPAEVEGLPTSLPLIDEMTKSGVRLVNDNFVTLIDTALETDDLPGALFAARSNGACIVYGSSGWEPPARPPAGTLAALPILPQDERDVEAAGAAVAGVLATGLAVAHPPAGLALPALASAVAADRYNNKGAFFDLLARGVGRFVDKDLQRECAVDSAAFLIGYLMGLPCCADAPSTRTAFAMLSTDAPALGGPGLIARPLGGAARARLIDRILIWLVTPAALETLARQPLSLAVSPKVAVDFVQAARRREAQIGVDVQQGGWEASDDEARVRWAFAQATAMLRTCAAAREAVQDKLVDGSSLGACALLVEERLGALESQRVDKGRGRPSLGQ